MRDAQTGITDLVTYTPIYVDVGTTAPDITQIGYLMRTITMGHDSAGRCISSSQAAVFIPTAAPIFVDNVEVVHPPAISHRMPMGTRSDSIL